jgi:hypothetical protein
MTAVEHWRQKFDEQRRSAVKRGDWGDYGALYSLRYWQADVEDPGLIQQGKLEIPEKDMGDVVTLADNAFRAGKYIYAGEAYGAAGKTREVFSRHVAEVNELLDANALDEAASSMVACGWLWSPTRNYQIIGPKLHEYCDAQECFVQGLSEEQLMDRVFSFLLGESMGNILLRRPQPLKAAVFGRIIRSFDSRWQQFCDGFEKAVDELLKAPQDIAYDEKQNIDLASLKRVFHTFRDAQATMLGRTTESGEHWQYIRELSFAHPPAAFCVCTQPNNFLRHGGFEERAAELLMGMLNRTMVPVLTPTGRPVFEGLGAL